MIRARAGAAVHAARLEFQMKRAEQREREALARAGELLAASDQPPAHGESQALLGEARRLRLELEAHSTAVTRSLEADRADYVAVAGWMRPLVVLRGLCARAVLRHRMTRCRRELRPLHERLAAAALAEPGATGIRVPGTLADAIRGAQAERETALAERTRWLARFDGSTLPAWLGRIAGEGKALGRALVKQLQGQLLPRASALAGLAAGWWVAHTYTDSRPRSLLRSIGIGHGGTHVVSGETYRAMSFWLPIVAAAVSAYLGDRIARWVRKHYHLPLLGLSGLVLGCGHGAPPAKLPEPPPAPAAPTQPAPPAPAQPAPPEQGQPRPAQVPRVMVFAGPPPGVTVTQAAPEPETEPEPTVGYASLRIACDSVEALAKRQHLAVSRADGVPVDFGFGGPARTGCELKASGKFVRAAPDSAAAPAQTEDEPSTLANGFKDAGWAYLAWYQADGPDGEVEGWRSKETTCVARWSWDGGDDSDSTYVPSDDWDLVIGCAPWAPEDSRRE